MRFKRWLMMIAVSVIYACPLWGQGGTSADALLDFPIDKKTSYAATMMGDTLMITFDQPRKISKADLNKKLPKGFKVREILSSKNATTLKITAVPGTKIEHERLPDKVLIHIKYDPSQVENHTADPKAAAQESKVQKPQHVNLKVWEQRESLRLKWTFDGERPPMAFFVKDEVEWVAFDGKLDIKVEGAMPRPYGYMEQEAHDQMTLFKIHLNDRLPYKIIEEKHGWEIVFGDEARIRKDILPPALKPFVSDDGTAVGVKAQGLQPGKVVEDKSRGSYFAIFATDTRDLGVKIPAHYADFYAAESRQGVVVVPRKRHIKVSLEPQGVAITTPDGLDVSSRADRERRVIASTDGDVFDFSRWDNLDPKKIISRKAELEYALSETEGLAQEKAYFDLANFLIAHGYEVEALGLLRLLGDEKPHVRHNPEYIALQSVAAYLVGDYHLGLQSISDLAVLSPKGKLWKAGLLASVDSEKSLALFAESQSLFSGLKEPLRSALGVKIVEAALEEKEIPLAEEVLGMMADPAPSFKDQVTLLSARVDEAKGKSEAFEVKLRDLAQSPADKANAEAELSLITLDLQNHKISTDEAIGRLENLRFSWRGDEVEFKTLTKLAELYRQKKNYKKSLSMMSMALRHFSPETAGYDQVKEEMSQTFLSLFNQDAGRLSPMTMIGLFQSFEHLLPRGEEGDKVILNLSKQMLSYELTSKAIRILENRVAHSTNPLLRQQLALAYLMDGQPEVAVSQSDQMLKEKLSPEVREKMILMKVKGLEDLGRLDDALKALQVLNTVQAERLRADIFEKKKEWSKLAKALENIVAKEKTPNPDMLFRWALALYKSGQEPKIKLMSEKYKDILAGSTFKEEIALLASPDLSEKISLDKLPLHLEQVDLFSASILDANPA